MSDPGYMHEFNPNRGGYCKTIVRGKICGLSQDREVHKRFKKQEPVFGTRVGEKTEIDGYVWICVGKIGELNELP